MRSMYGPEALLKSSKKPRIQKLVSDCLTMTDEQIDLLDEKPDVKRGLRNIRKEHEGIGSAARAELIADMMTAAFEASKKAS